MSIATSLRGTGGLLVLGGSLGAAAAALATRAVHVAPTATGPAAHVEDWVELAITGGAALAAAWVAFGALLGLVVVIAAAAGARWRGGEAAVRALAPAVVHRLVRAGIGAGVGAGLVLAPTTAMAAPAADPATVTATTSQATATIDLGWRPTAHADAAEPTAAAPAAEAPAPSPEPEPEPAPAPAPEDVTAVPQPTMPPTTVPPTTVPQPTGAQPASPEAASTTSATAGTPGPTAAPLDVARTEALPAAGTQDPAPATRRAPVGADGTVVVLRGDTLWDIAAGWLGGDPTDAQVLAASVAWHQANRAVIGADPDLILPGQILTAPDASA